jgi:hypothetical protein
MKGYQNLSHTRWDADGGSRPHGENELARYKRLNGRVSRWTDLRTFNAASLNVPSRLPPVDHRPERVTPLRSPASVLRMPPARPTQPLLPNRLVGRTVKA